MPTGTSPRKSLNPYSNGMWIEPSVTSQHAWVLCLNPYSNGMWIEQSYLSVIWNICSSVTLYYPIVVQSLRLYFSKSSQMPSFFNVKCWKTIVGKIISSWISIKYKFRKIRKCLADFLWKRGFAKNPLSEAPFYRVQNYSFFANVANNFRFFCICEDFSVSYFGANSSKPSKWGSCENSIFRKWFCDFLYQ